MSATRGVSYVQWGKTACSGAGVETLFNGIAAGAFFDHRGGASEYICLPDSPEYPDFHAPGLQIGRARVHGVEYETNEVPSIPSLGALTQHNVPCAICHVPDRGAKIMIPARYTCPDSWTAEYHGYLMSEHTTHYRMPYECVDSTAEAIPGTSADVNGALVWLTEMHCPSSSSCPDGYVNGMEVSCVVCTK